MLGPWIKAIRLRTLPLALTGTLMGAFLAFEQHGFKWPIFIFSTITTVSLQILSNLANDYGDSIHGADSQKREGPSRTVQSGLISLQSMKIGMIVLAVLCLIFGITTLVISFKTIQLRFVLLMLLGISAIAAAIKYTVGNNPYGYIGLGDFFVFIFFGPIAVLGNIFLYNHQINAWLLLPAISVGLMSVGVLNINNIRDIQSDKLAGKMSIPVRIGRKRAVYYHLFLLITIPLLLTIYCFATYQNVVQLLFLMTTPLYIINFKAVKSKTLAMELDPFLKQLALSSILMVIIYGLGIFLKEIL